MDDSTKEAIQALYGYVLYQEPIMMPMMAGAGGAGGDPRIFFRNNVPQAENA
jgi:hypothetical protein